MGNRIRRAATTVLLSLAAVAARAEPPLVAVSIPPQAWFVERLGGADFRTLVLVGPGESPATYDPEPRRLVELSQAAVWLRIGVPMENGLLGRLHRSLPDLRIVDVRDGIAGISPKADGAHAHDEDDPHVWLDPKLARVLARNTCEALVAVAPARADTLRARLAALDGELSALDARLAATLAPVRGEPLVVYHPAFGRFARAYGLRQVAVEEGGLAPSPRHVADVLKLVRERGVRTIFAQPQFSESSARAIAREAHLKLVVLDPLARDYAANLESMAAAIAAGLRR